MVALLFQQLFLLEIPFSVPISHAVMFHKRPRVVSHFDFWYVVSSVLPDADAVVRRSLVVAGMGKKSLIKSGDGDGGGGDAVLSLPPPKICMQMKSRYASRADVGGRTRTESN